MRIGNKDFSEKNHTYVMGILNVTTDSFSDGGQLTDSDNHISVEKAIDKVARMIEEGADIIDVGGESTRPGYIQISIEEETERVVPVIRAIRERFDIPISLDTYKWQVAKEGIAAGAHLLNDIHGLRYDNGEMADLIAKADIPCCLMYNVCHCSTPGDVINDVSEGLAASLHIAEKAGIKDENIILDPGVGFAGGTDKDLAILNNLDRISKLGYPLLVGASRKSVIGNTLSLPVNERLYGTVAISTLAATKGVSFIRVHDIRANKEAVRMTEAILRA
jgi:dihydropteroate synthase